MHHGILIEQGQHEYLLQQHGHYAQMYDQQVQLQV